MRSVWYCHEGSRGLPPIALPLQKGEVFLRYYYFGEIIQQINQ